MIETEKKTCKDLIFSEYEKTNAMLEELNDKINDTESDDETVSDAIEELNDFSLEISSYKVVKILLSTGGPADWVEVKLDDENDIIGMSYHYADWFDHAEMPVESNSYLWDYAVQIVNQ